MRDNDHMCAIVSVRYLRRCTALPIFKNCINTFDKRGLIGLIYGISVGAYVFNDILFKGVNLIFNVCFEGARLC